ncbi:hypothetical protein [Haloimpatiens lingqiaonensis]|nr:hypothetical protein [Haloimpatiens lingqiaonensis]
MDSRKSTKNSPKSKSPNHSHNSKKNKNISSRNKLGTFSLKFLDYDTF